MLFSRIVSILVTATLIFDAVFLALLAFGLIK